MRLPCKNPYVLIIILQTYKKTKPSASEIKVSTHVRFLNIVIKKFLFVARCKVEESKNKQYF